MKFSIDRRYFFEKLSIVARAISVFSPLPALSGIHIEVKEDEIILTGSDSNISIQTMIRKGELNQLQIESTGSIVIESKYLLEIIRKIDSTMVDLELIDFTLVRISSTNGKFHLNGIKSQEYPEIDLTRPENHIVLKTDTLKQIVDQTVFACSDNEQRPVLKGVNFNAKENKLNCSGSDSYRLAHKSIELDQEYSFNVTIPSKSLIEVTRSFGEDIDDVDIYLNDKKAQFIFDKTVFQTRLLDSTYPNVERIIPSSSVSNMEVNAKELLSVIDRTNFIRKDKIHYVKFECSSKEVRVKTSSTEIGNSDEVLTDCVYQGEDFQFTCNGSYLLDAIKALNGERVVLEFSSITQIAPIRISNPDDNSVIMIVVPIRSYD